MGFNVVALAQKARTQTLIVDSDLDMGQYDVIATDVKGDTAEFSEFVGGVGNFESGLISGGLDVGGNVTGNIQGFLFVKGNIQTSGDVVYAKCDAQSFTGVPNMYEKNAGTFTVNGYSIIFGNPQKHETGVYTRRSDLTGTAPSNPTTRKVTIKNNDSTDTATVYYKLNTSTTYNKTSSFGPGSSVTLNLDVGKTYNWYVELRYGGSTNYDGTEIRITIAALTTYYVKYATP